MADQPQFNIYMQVSGETNIVPIADKAETFFTIHFDKETKQYSVVSNLTPKTAKVYFDPIIGYLKDLISKDSGVEVQTIKFKNTEEMQAAVEKLRSVGLNVEKEKTDERGSIQPADQNADGGKESSPSLSANA